MEKLVIYYSRSGRTKKVALKLAESLNAGVIQIIDKKERKGFLCFISSCLDAIKHKKTRIEYNKGSIQISDLICIGTPVWAGTIPPAVRTFLSENSFKNKKILLFCTAASSPWKKTIDEMRKMIPNAAIVKVFGLTGKDINSDKTIEYIIKNNISGL